MRQTADTIGGFILHGAHKKATAACSQNGRRKRATNRYAFRRLRRMSIPAAPIPNMPRVVGSGTAAGEATESICAVSDAIISAGPAETAVGNAVVCELKALSIRV